MVILRIQDPWWILSYLAVETSGAICIKWYHCLVWPWFDSNNFFYGIFLFLHCLSTYFPSIFSCKFSDQNNRLSRSCWITYQITSTQAVADGTSPAYRAGRPCPAHARHSRAVPGMARPSFGTCCAAGTARPHGPRPGLGSPARQGRPVMCPGRVGLAHDFKKIKK